ncbi:MAG: sugar phosphate isomerase/epimerase family protein [Planctomycetota bacterium]
MDISITTDFAKDTGDPSPYLRQIAEAGFTHIHWCHQWNTDFLYSESEIAQIERWLNEYKIRLLDLHASAGKEKNWASPRDYERLAGVELVKNRIDMTARLGGHAIVLHVPPESDPSAVRRSLGEIRPHARNHNVRIAFENGDFAVLRGILSEYAPDFAGLCYDSGHGNLKPDGLDNLESLAERLVAIHLHDNDGASDQHKIPFTGTVDWNRFTRILSRSSYNHCVSLEVSTRHAGIAGEKEFLARSREAAERLTNMLRKAKNDFVDVFLESGNVKENILIRRQT